MIRSDEKINLLRLAIAQGELDRSEFSDSLISQYQRWRRLSDKQWYWVDRLLADAEWSEDTADFTPIRPSALRPQKAIGRTYFKILRGGVRHVVWVPRNGYPPKGYERSS